MNQAILFSSYGYLSKQTSRSRSSSVTWFIHGSRSRCGSGVVYTSYSACHFFTRSLSVSGGRRKSVWASTSGSYTFSSRIASWSGHTQEYF